MRLAGLTWDHPRGYEALQAAQSDPAAPGCPIDWARQPLEGFESAPIAETAGRYDLIVLDHPHIGEAITTDALLPLDGLFDPETLAAWRSATVGASFDSYQVDGHQWAVPLDAATQVSVSTADIADDLPATWPEVVAFAGQVTTVLPLAGPHPLLTLCSIALSDGAEPAAGDGDFLPAAVVASALDTMRRIGIHSIDDPVNPITLLDRMSRSRDPLYCPHVYGYVNYARSERAGRLVFADAPRGAAGIGSVLGGTGIAVSSRCTPTPELAAHLRWLMDPATQSGFIPGHAGQPSRVEAWDDDRVNAGYGQFYRRTRDTIDTAWVRPRYDGFIGFQSEAAEQVRRAVRGQLDATELAERLTGLHRSHHEPRKVTS